tara:strand:+ start:716 stop:1273 length:558 start_codon:yes stop_codon:yes gene_type:complete
MILSLFRSAKGNWVNRINKLFANQLKIARDGLSSSERDADRYAFAEALDYMSILIKDYELHLDDVASVYIKYDMKKAKPIHKLALKNPEKLSEKDKIVLFDGMGLIMNNLNRLSPRMFALKQTGALGFLMGALGIVCFPEVREKGFKLWSYVEDCLPLCEKFIYKKHLPKELIKLLDTEVFKSKN